MGKAKKEDSKKGEKAGKKKPVKYDLNIAKKVCMRLGRGESLRSISQDPEMPSTNAVLNWTFDHEEFARMYERARAKQAEVYFEEVLEIAHATPDAIVGDDRSDNARVAAERLRVDTLKWVVARMAPWKFGDKVDVTSGGKAIKEPRAAVINYFAPGHTLKT